jgi:hypothetical protein
MSVGNLNTEGNKKNNFPWQLKVLQGLQTIINNGTTCCNDLSGILTDIYDRIQPRQRIPVVISTTTSGEVPDCYSFSIANIGTAAGTVEGQTLPAGATVNFDAGTLNNYFKSPAMSYNASGTTFLITYITD